MTKNDRIVIEATRRDKVADFAFVEDGLSLDELLPLALVVVDDDGDGDGDTECDDDVEVRESGGCVGCACDLCIRLKRSRCCCCQN